MFKISGIKSSLALAAIVISLFSCANAGQAAEMDSFAINDAVQIEDVQVEKNIKDLEKLGTYYFCLGQYKKSKDCFERALKAIRQAVEAGELSGNYENLNEYAEMIAVVARLAK